MTPAKKAIIYCRVSDKKQKHDGNGLQSQEHRCRDYATARGYEVEAVFHDDVSGGGDFMKRPGMVAMLNFMDKRAHEGYERGYYVFAFQSATATRNAAVTAGCW